MTEAGKAVALATLSGMSRDEIESLVMLQAEDLAHAQRALDQIYGHNEAARAAVVEHYGTLHRMRTATILAGSREHTGK